MYVGGWEIQWVGECNFYKSKHSGRADGVSLLDRAILSITAHAVTPHPTTTPPPQKCILFPSPVKHNIDGRRCNLILQRYPTISWLFRITLEKRQTLTSWQHCYFEQAPFWCTVRVDKARCVTKISNIRERRARGLPRQPLERPPEGRRNLRGDPPLRPGLLLGSSTWMLKKWTEFLVQQCVKS